MTKALDKILPALLAGFLSLVCPAAQPAHAAAGGGTPAAKTGAAAAYATGDYGAALRLYAAELPKSAAEVTHADGRLSEVYYDMGNCAFRMKDYPGAVLYYTRALRHNPANGDAAFNLTLTRGKLSLPEDEGGEMFFVTWGRGVVSSHTATQWGLAAWGGLAFAAVGLLLFYLGRRIWVRKCGVAAVLLGTAATLLCFGFAAAQQNAFENDDSAVALRPAPCYATPTATAAKAADLREGTLIRMTGTESGQWAEALLPDGRRVWLHKGEGTYALVRDI